MDRSFHFDSPNKLRNSEPCEAISRLRVSLSNCTTRGQSDIVVCTDYRYACDVVVAVLTVWNTTTVVYLKNREQIIGKKLYG